MSEMTDRAIARMTQECQKAEHLIPFEEYLTSICTNDYVAGKILQEDKTLAKCFEGMKEIARGRAVKGCAYIPPEEGYKIIRDYYGISTEAQQEQSSHKNVIDITDLL